MDYEKAYKEALERAKVFINSSKSENWSKKTARAIFPELRESDDEKIRKELLEHVKYCSESIPERAAMIAWLEKQGQTFTKKDVDDAYLKGISDAKNELEKQGEPTDIPVDAVLDSNKDGLIADTIKYKNEQKPVEWSEEDEKGLADALWCCGRAVDTARDENEMGNCSYAENWLKSLRPQKQWKPSELQLEALGTLLGCHGIKDEQRRKVIEELFEQLKAL